MNPIDALLIGLGFGVILGLAQRFLRAPSGMKSGAGVWLSGEVASVARRFSKLEGRPTRFITLMRDSYPKPLEGGELVLKPIGGGKARRGSYICEADSAWKLQLK